MPNSFRTCRKIHKTLYILGQLKLRITKKRQLLLCIYYTSEKEMDPYGMALKGDRQGFLHYFAQQTDEELLGYRTFNGECAIHVVAAMEDLELIKKFLGRLPVEKRLEALMQTDDNGNTAVHALATINNVDVAKTLVEFSKQSNDADKNPLEVKNKLGETPLYRAASVGKIEALRYFAEQVGDSNLRHHFRRHDNIPILHIAVLSHHVGNNNQISHSFTRSFILYFKDSLMIKYG